MFTSSVSKNCFPMVVRFAAGACLIIKNASLIGVLGAALLATRAPAADLELRAPPPVPYPSWSGPYIGIAGGARYNAVDGNVTSATVGTPPAAIHLPTVSSGSDNPLELWGSGPGAMQYIDNVAFRFALYGGWNLQVAPVYVVGVEVDFAYANETSVFHGSPYPANLLFGAPNTPFGASPNDEFKVTTGWDGSVRVRGGWLATPSTLLYLTAGVAWAHLQATSTCSTEPTPNVSNCAPGNYFSGTLGPDVITHSATKVGWTAGGGIDMWLGSNWLFRAQYRFSAFGYPSGSPASFTDTRACIGCPSPSNTPLTVSYELPLMQHIFEVGVAYKFGEGRSPDSRSAPIARTVAIFSWTGFYIGANAGYGGAHGSDGPILTGNPSFANVAATGSHDLKGGIVGGQIGFNYQMGAAVLGMEADVNWSGQKRATSTSCGPLCTFDESLEANAFSTVRGRAGGLINRVLVYATAGIASIHVKDVVDVTVNGSLRNVISSNSSKTGWTLGAGVEMPFGASFSGKIEYLYIAVDNFSQTGLFPGGGTVTETASIRDNLVRAGLNYHF